MLAGDLVYDASGAGGGDDFEDDDDDYGEEVMGDAEGEDIDLGFEEDEDLQGDQTDEKALVKQLQDGAQSFDKATLAKAITSIGRATVLKIIEARKVSGTEHFSKAEKEAIAKLF